MSFKDRSYKKNTNILNLVKEKMSFITDNKKISEIKDRIMDSNIYSLIEENKNLAILIVSLAGLIILLIILLFASISVNKKGSQKKYSEPLILAEPVLSPKNKQIDSGYSITRETKDNWSNEEAEQWFTIPSDAEIEALSKTNDSIINDILGATP